MTKKRLVIDDCNQCPHFNNQYYDWAEFCEELNRKIDGDNDCSNPIPHDCPLQDVDDMSGVES